MMSIRCELPHPTALGATRPSLVEGGASCFCVGACIRRGHSGSRLRRRLPFRGGSECPTPTEWTLGHNRRCALLVTLEHRRRRGEHRTTFFHRRGSKGGGKHVNDSCGRCIPSLLASLAEGGSLAPSITAKEVYRTESSFIRSSMRLASCWTSRTASMFALIEVTPFSTR